MEGHDDAAFDVAQNSGAPIAGRFEAEGTIVGDGRTRDQVRFNEFPSSRQFMKVVADPRRLKGHEDHRDPAMADTTPSLPPQAIPCANAEPANRHVRVLVCPWLRSGSAADRVVLA